MMKSSSTRTRSRQGEERSLERPTRIGQELPYFSRSQVGVILLLGAVLMLLYAWRAHWLFPPAPPPPGVMPLAFVEVTGKAAHPGVYSFPHAPTLREVWQRAGVSGAAPQPNRRIAGGSRVEVTPEGGYRVSAMSGAQLLTLGQALDLNSASAEDLAALPGIGPALAQRLVDYRATHGPFNRVDELQDKVAGFGPKKMEKLKPFLVVIPASSPTAP